MMDRATVYRLWQAPFADRKLEPLRRHNDLSAARRVLDVGCGPGTNARHFGHTDYLGLDHNPDYISFARRRYGNRFVLGDVRDDLVPFGVGFDFILVNSLLHHVDTPSVRRLLSRLAALLTPEGHVHILDLVMPERRGLPRLLARWDRGEHARPLATWKGIFAEAFEPAIFEPYRLGIFGVTLWDMVYFKGRRRA